VATVIEPSTLRVNAQQAELLRLREKFLKNDRILGPAWILLIRLVEQSASSTSIEVCDLISIPNISATTAQRCLEYLLTRGWVRLGAGPGKRFRTVDLAPLALAELRFLFASIDNPVDSKGGLSLSSYEFLKRVHGAACASPRALGQTPGRKRPPAASSLA